MDTKNMNSITYKAKVITPFFVVPTTINLSKNGNQITVFIDGSYDVLPKTGNHLKRTQYYADNGTGFKFPDGTICSTEEIWIEEGIPKGFRPSRLVKKPIDIYTGGRYIGSLEIA